MPTDTSEYGTTGSNPIERVIAELWKTSPEQFGDVDECLHEARQVERVMRDAADSLIEVHEATGINLYAAPAWLNLVRAIYPAWSSDQRDH